MPLDRTDEFLRACFAGNMFVFLYRNLFCIWVFSYTGLNSVDFCGFYYLFGSSKISESIWDLKTFDYKLIKIIKMAAFPVAAPSKASACSR
jgi:hypothetical protein